MQTVEVPNTTNRELFAAETDLFADFDEKAAALPDVPLRALMQRLGAALEPYSPGELILTDDRAPVEKLGMAVIDGLIQEELGYYKTIRREEGISGLFASVSP